jgi:LysR family glycine cleavage system transcriptional activator
MALPPLNSLRVFESVARLGHVGAAAAELHVTPGAVSQQIRALQLFMGVELFQKRGRQLALTESGVTLRRSVAKAMDAIMSGVKEVSAARLHPGGIRSLAISIPQVHGVAWLASRLFEFIVDNPTLNLRITTSGHFEGVDWRKTDIAVIYGVPPWLGFWWKLLHGIELTPVCSPQLLRGPTAIRQPSDLAYHRLLHEDDGSQWRRYLTALGSGIAAQSDVYFDDFAIVLQAARDGFGVALTDEIISARDLDDGRLVQPFSLSVPAIHNYYCVCSEASREREEVAYFIEWLISEASRVLASRSSL